MPRTSLRATCRLCGGSYSASGMTRHLQACLAKNRDKLRNGKRSAKTRQVMYLTVRGYGMAGDYWLHLAVTADTRLNTLDQFLRDTWLECCGHLSCFTIDGLRYDVHPFDLSDRSMNHRIGNILEPGLEFSYEYDFGSTSYLDLRVADVFDLTAPKEPIQVLARNDPPDVPCQVCGEAPGAWICPFCIYEDAGWLCESCAEAHECEDDVLLPVVNSPRTGICGYVGPDA